MSDDYDALTQAVQRGSTLASVRATSTLDANPDDAAESLRLSDATGTPSTVINADLPKFQQQYKSMLATDIVHNDPTIANYIQSHPLASSVSNDDYGTLSSISQMSGTFKTFLRSAALSALPSVGSLPAMGAGAEAGAAIGAFGGPLSPFTVPAGAVVGGAIAGLTSAHYIAKAQQAAISTLGPDIQKLLGVDQATQQEDQAQHPYASFAGSAATSLPFARFGGTLLQRIFAGGLTGGFEAGREAYEGQELSPRDIALSTALGIATPGMSKVGERINNVALDFVRNYRQEINKAGVEQLDNIIAEVQKSTTKERATKLLADNFLSQQYEDARLGISGKAASDLYGDKVPEADDGILGWAPNIAEQLQVARETGVDISIPYKDYIANVDPEVHKALHKDLRPIEDGITEREAKENPPDTPAIDEALTRLKNVGGQEPMFSIGDRKLTLNRMAQKVAGPFGPEQGFHDFDMVNENGQKIGALNISEQKGGKELYVEDMESHSYYHPNDFGPALMRDLLRQVKAAFPNAEWLTGHRVSGARGLAGTYDDNQFAFPRIRLEEPMTDMATHDKFSQLMGGAWHDIGFGTEAYVKPTDLFNQHEQELNAAVEAERQRIAPKDTIVAPVTAMRRTNKEGPQGLYYPQGFTEKPLILWAMDSSDSVGTFRHEVIHDLYRRGFFTPNEWSTFQQASKDEGWIDKFDINRRYPHLDQAGKVEESIADAFKQWKRESDNRKAHEGPGFSLSPIDQIFAKLKDLLDSVKAHVKRITGTENVDDLFQRVDSGEVRDRGPSTQGEGVAASEPPISESGQGIDVRSPFRGARDVGMTLEAHKLYMKTVEAQQQANLRTSVARVKKEVEKRQNAEWKAQGEAMRPQVISDLNSRPPIAADKFFGLGELFGKKLDKTYRLDWDSLTPEQRKAIPESYTVRKDGVKPDEVANLLGFPNGDLMIQGIAGITKARELSGLRRDRFMRTMVDDEINRRMELEHGFKDMNIEQDTRDQVLSENQLSLVHQETMHLANMAGQTEGNITLEGLTSAAQEQFDTLETGSQSTAKYLREAGKNEKLIELSLLQGKAADAYKYGQLRQQNTIYAAMANKVEKARAQVNKTAKGYAKVNPPKMDAVYLNHIQDLLQKAGYKVGRSPENIAENISRRGQDLAEFIRDRFNQSIRSIDIPLPDVIDQNRVGPVDKMTTFDFMGFKQTLDALIKTGKDEDKIYREGETADRKYVVDTIKGEIVDKFEDKGQDYSESRMSAIKKMPKLFIAASVSMETFGRRISSRNPLALFMKHIVYPAFNADNNKARLIKEFAGQYLKLGEIKDAHKPVVSPFLDPSDMKPMAGFTNRNMQAVVHNFGNDSNIKTLTASFIDPTTMKPVTVNKLRAWVEATATPEMWDRAQELGKIFNGIMGHADNLYERMVGITIDKIPLKPFSVGGKNYEGWYHPLIEDPKREGKQDLRLSGPDFGKLSTRNGYTWKRSGTIYPLDLNPDMIPARITQEIHDIAYREFIANAQKILRDPGLTNAINNHIGTEYNWDNFFKPWLEDLAGQASTHSQAMAMLSRVSEKMRSNVVGTYIGYNAYTVFKHTFTAAVFSLRQVGLKQGLWAMHDLYGKSPAITQAKHDFIMESSDEIRRRNKHWLDSIYGAHNELEGQSSFRSMIQEKGTWAIAKGDMFSSKYTWWGAYNDAKTRLDLDHGAAVELADSAVRQAHGTVAAPGRPAFLRGGGPLNSWLTSVYGFMGTRLQRLIELGQDIHETYGLTKQGEWRSAAKNLPGILTDAAVYLVWPIMIEEAASGITTDDHRSWGRHLLDAATEGTASSLLYFRDIVHGLVEGNDVGVGLISSFLHDVVNAKNDIRPDMFTKQRMGKTAGDILTVIGDFQGIAPKTIDNAIRFGIDIYNGKAHPQGVGDWVRGLTKGKTEPRELK